MQRQDSPGLLERNPGLGIGLGAAAGVLGTGAVGAYGAKKYIPKVAKGAFASGLAAGAGVLGTALAVKKFGPKAVERAVRSFPDLMRYAGSVKNASEAEVFSSRNAALASAGILGAAGVTGGIPLARYLRESAPYHGKSLGVVKQKATAEIPLLLQYLLGRGMELTKKASDDEKRHEALLMGGTGLAGLGTGALLAAGLKARQGSRLLEKVRTGTGIAASVPALYAAASKVWHNKENAKSLIDDVVAIAKSLRKEASEDYTPYAMGGAGIAGIAAGAYPAAKYMDRRIRGDAVEAAIVDLLSGDAYNRTPKQVRHAISGIGAAGTALAGYGTLRNYGRHIPEILRRFAGAAA